MADYNFDAVQLLGSVGWVGDQTGGGAPFFGSDGNGGILYSTFSNQTLYLIPDIDNPTTPVSLGRFSTIAADIIYDGTNNICLLYTSPSPRDS